jgi:hypothetical protein
VATSAPPAPVLRCEFSALCDLPPDNRSTTNQAKQDHHDRDDQKNMNESTHGV